MIQVPFAYCFCQRPRPSFEALFMCWVDISCPGYQNNFMHLPLFNRQETLIQKSSDREIIILELPGVRLWIASIIRVLRAENYKCESILM